jgi:PadR family transcriptional regulator, regulatory protein PadR
MRNKLGQFEEFVLLALVRLRANAYGAAIRREIAEQTGRDVSVGAVYSTLERLGRKGYVSSWLGEATPERGGRAKRYFKIEAPGAEALTAVTTAAARLAEGLAYAS